MEISEKVEIYMTANVNNLQMTCKQGIASHPLLGRHVTRHVTAKIRFFSSHHVTGQKRKLSRHGLRVVGTSSPAGIKAGSEISNPVSGNYFSLLEMKQELAGIWNL